MNTHQQTPDPATYYRRDGEALQQKSPLAPVIPMNVTGACPRCRQRVTTHRFTTHDGLFIVTYHCARHGDVVPMHSF